MLHNTAMVPSSWRQRGNKGLKTDMDRKLLWRFIDEAYHDAWKVGVKPFGFWHLLCPGLWRFFRNTCL